MSDIYPLEEASYFIKNGIDMVYKAIQPLVGSKKNHAMLIKQSEEKNSSQLLSIIQSEHKLEQFGIRTIVQLALNVHNHCGDGLLYTILLGRTLYNEFCAVKQDKEAILKEIITIITTIQQELKRLTVPLKLKDFASSITDEEHGEFITKLIDKKAVHIEGYSDKRALIHETALVVKHGYASPYFATNRAMQCILKNPKIFLYNTFNAHHVKTILSTKEPFILITSSIAEQLLQELISYRIERNIHCCVVVMPQNEIHEIAIFCEADANIGTADDITVDSTKTVININSKCIGYRLHTPHSIETIENAIKATRCATKGVFKAPGDILIEAFDNARKKTKSNNVIAWGIVKQTCHILSKTTATNRDHTTEVTQYSTLECLVKTLSNCLQLLTICNSSYIIS